MAIDQSNLTDLDLATRLDRVESRQELHELVSNYCHGVDKHDEATFMGIWHDDAVWAIGPPFGDFSGKDEVRRALVEVIWPAWNSTHHWTTNSVFDVDGDRATGVCDVGMQGEAADGTTTFVSATYTDRFERRAGRWGIVHRGVEIHYFAPAPGITLTPPPEG